MEENSPQDILEFEMPDGSSWKLAGWRRVSAWLAELEKFWAWLPSSTDADPANIRGTGPQRYMQVISDAGNIRGQGGAPHDLHASVAQWFDGQYVLPHPRSERGKLIAAIREDAGDEAALFAIGILDRLLAPSNASSLAQLRGAMMAACPEICKAAPKVRNLQEGRRRIDAALASLEHEEDLRQLERDRLWNESLVSAGQAAVRWSQRRARRYQNYLLKARREENAAMESIRAVETTYREKMGLKAPVDYWKKKSSGHRESEDRLRWIVVGFFAVAMIAIILAFWNVGWTLINLAIQPGAKPLPPGVYVVASAGLGAAAAVLFWGGRLLTKLYLSQHHLRQDADERATMTETYLALIENRAADTEDRQVILNALFRATPDGIVKEDGGLDPSIAAALGKYLAK